ncbi:MAG TPA: hypothetical protein DCQ56_07545 [Porphyromonadaceae bacterium]|nr:hypothetical protein [Porphyromonadaceae bacterium]
MKKGLHFFVTALLVTLFAVGATAQPASGYYKIQNRATQKYVSVKGKYYAKPDATEADATPIYVEVGERIIVDRIPRYKVIGLSGGGYDVFAYLNHAVDLANMYVDNVMSKGNNALTPDEVALAHELIGQYKDEYGFLMLDEIDDNTWALEVQIPDVNDPALFPEVHEHAIAHGITDGDIWGWCKRKVMAYLNREGNTTDHTLKTLIKKYLDQIECGHIYLLTAEADDTFGFVDDLDFDSTGEEIEWILNSYTPESGMSGYYRIMNAGTGKFVNVYGKFEADPMLTADEARTEPGSVIYVGMGDRVGSLAQEVTRLSAQGRNVNALVEKGVKLAKDFAYDFVDKVIANDPSFADYRDNAINLIDNYKFDKTVYVTSIPSSAGDAFYCSYTTPSMDQLANTVATAFSLGKGQGWASRHPYWFNFDEQGKAISLNQQAFWESAKDSIKDELKVLGYATRYPDLYKRLVANLNRINPGETYYLTADRDDTFGYVKSADLEAAGDMAKWVLDPVVNDGNYFAVAPTLAHTSAAEVKYVTTLYTDFPYTLPDGVEAYKVTGIEQQEGAKGYICTKAAISGKVPAETPVLLICSSSDAEDCKLEPVDEFGQNAGTQGAPARVTKATADNLLVAAYFDEQAESQNLRALGENGGVGFCLPASQLDGNVAYLDADQLNPSTEEIYYIFPEEEETGISTLVSDAQVVNVKYVNAAGQVADAAFDGVNIVVKTLNNGAKVITKVVK